MTWFQASNWNYKRSQACGWQFKEEQRISVQTNQDLELSYHLKKERDRGDVGRSHCCVAKQQWSARVVAVCVCVCALCKVVPSSSSFITSTLILTASYTTNNNHPNSKSILTASYTTNNKRWWVTGRSARCWSAPHQTIRPWSRPAFRWVPCPGCKKEGEQRVKGDVVVWDTGLDIWREWWCRCSLGLGCQSGSF